MAFVADRIGGGSNLWRVESSGMEPEERCASIR